MPQSVIAKWTNPTHDRDGNPYGEAEHGGYVATVDNGAPITLGLTWGTQFDLGTLPEVQALKAGPHAVTIAPVSKKGVVGAVTGASFSLSPIPAALGNFSITQG